MTTIFPLNYDETDYSQSTRALLEAMYEKNVSAEKFAH
jgi:hypothetical protein